MHTGKSERNQSLDQVRLLASFMVILIHAPLPGIIGIIAESISRIAVPLFFIISGYYSSGTISRKLKEKTARTAKMLLWSVLMYLAWEIAWSFYHGTTGQKLQQYFSIAALLETFVLNTGVWLGHLWFLLALVYCYILYGLFFRNYRQGIKTALSIGLIGVHFLLRELLKANGIVDTTYYTRNFIFTGIPFFLLGDIIFQNRDLLNRITLWGRWAFILAGIVMAFAERIYVGCSDLYLGTVLASTALFMLVQDHQLGYVGRLAQIGKTYAGEVYIFHVMVLGVVNRAASVGGILYTNGFLLLRPFVVLCLCIVVSGIKTKTVNMVNRMR